MLWEVDGFNYEILGLNIEEVVEQCKDQKGLEALQRRIREAEEKDRGANRQPRFKKSDDMSVVIDRPDRIQEKTVNCTFQKNR